MDADKLRLLNNLQDTVDTLQAQLVAIGINARMWIHDDEVNEVFDSTRNCWHRGITVWLEVTYSNESTKRIGASFSTSLRSERTPGFIYNRLIQELVYSAIKKADV